MDIREMRGRDQWSFPGDPDRPRPWTRSRPAEVGDAHFPPGPWPTKWPIPVGRDYRPEGKRGTFILRGGSRLSNAPVRSTFLCRKDSYHTSLRLQTLPTKRGKIEDRDFKLPVINWSVCQDFLAEFHNKRNPTKR